MRPELHTLRAVAYLSAALLAVSCSDGSTGPDGDAGIRVVSGGTFTDTIDALPGEPLVVEIRRRNGQPAAGIPLRWSSYPPIATSPVAGMWFCANATPQSCGLSIVDDTTDANGRASVPIRLGRIPRQVGVEVSVPSLGLVDSVPYTVTVGNPAFVRALNRDTLMLPGATLTLGGRVVDRYENPRPESVVLSAGPGSAATINTTTGLTTATDIGVQWFYFRYNALSDSSRVRVVPPGRIIAVVGDQIRLVNTDGSNSKTLLTGLIPVNGGLPRFDASRQRYSFENGPLNCACRVFTIDTAGAGRRDIDIGATHNSVFATRLLADGTLLLLAQKTPNQFYTLFRVEPNNTLTALVDIPGMRTLLAGADISPDGSRVVFLAPSTSAPFQELRMISVTTGAVTVLEPQAHSPRWSNQGDVIAFATPAGLVTMRPDKTARRLVLAGTFVQGLAWSPDAAFLLATEPMAGATANVALRAVRVSDGANVPVLFRASTTYVSHQFPDWR